jgi:hypothetical protein
MGFYVYITRRQNPNPGESGPAIELSEWQSIVADDATFQPPATRTSGKAHESLWTGHPEWPETWFVWADGQIEIKSPDEPLVTKAVTLAKKLDAQVIAESGETYNEDGTHKGFVDGDPW